MSKCDREASIRGGPGLLEAVALGGVGGGGGIAVQIILKLQWIYHIIFLA